MSTDRAPVNSFAGLPGGELVEQGLADLQAGVTSEAALLVLIASPRLRAAGIVIPETKIPRPYEHQLYHLLESQRGRGAHSHYNSLIRLIVSFARALPD